MSKYKQYLSQLPIGRIPSLCNEDTTTEYAMIIKAICDYHQINPKDLAQLTYTYVPWDTRNENRIRHIRQIPYKVFIPEVLAPNTRDKSEEPSLDLTVYPNPTLEDPYDAGIQEYEIQTHKDKIRLWRWRGFRNTYPVGNYIEIVEKHNLKKLYRYLIEGQRDIPFTLQPVFEPDKLKDIYDNSIGFLERGKLKLKTYREHNISCKRGILLAGDPGCGKTLCCKWLRQLCVQKGFSYKVVTFENYRDALANGAVTRLFRLAPGEWGIIFFDDMDMVFQPKSSGNTHVQTFLTELDGIEPTEGIVYVFTSNQVGDLDKAFVRPGRIDLFMIFQAPNKKLRRVFVENRFHPDLLSALSNSADRKEIIKNIVNRTDKYTFAEMEEIRKLMTIDLLDGKEVSIEKTFEIFDKHRQEFAERMRFGYCKLDEDAEDYDNLNWEEFSIPMPPMSK